mmetsp:Transcript_19041/g.28983  ORF Transcript_19041/g.28983 Transcript_19041/m.28983 type:complete len:204 (+) Transcript_19041:362-973(+)
MLRVFTIYMVAHGQRSGPNLIRLVTNDAFTRWWRRRRTITVVVRQDQKWTMLVTCHQRLRARGMKFAFVIVKVRKGENSSRIEAILRFNCEDIAIVQLINSAIVRNDCRRKRIVSAFTGGLLFVLIIGFLTLGDILEGEGLWSILVSNSTNFTIIVTNGCTATLLSAIAITLFTRVNFVIFVHFVVTVINRIICVAFLSPKST